MKKIISMLLVITMIITCMVPIMASEKTTSDSALANAIKAVKEKIEIPSDYNKFNYYINSDGELTTWDLEWTSENGKVINVSINQNNLISRYYSFDRDASSDDKKIPKYSKEQGQVIAEKFINKLDSKLLKQFKFTEEDHLYSSNCDYIFDYVRNTNGIQSSFDNISITVNKYTGAVKEYSCTYSSDVTFEDASKIISNEQAKKAFIEKLGLKMVYLIQEKDKKKTSFLAYVPKYSNKYIDALTGEVEDVPVNSFNEFLKEKGAAYTLTSAVGDVAVVSLTPEELDAVNNMTGVMSKEDADKKVRGISLFGIDGSFKLSNSNLNKNWRDNESFVWNLNYIKEISKDKQQYINVQIDAKSGEIQNFSCNGEQDEGTKPLKTKEEAKAICDDVLKNLFSSKYDKLKYDDSYSNSIEEKTQDYFTFRFARMENGIECSDNYVEISYNNISGNVSRVNSNWDNKVIFEVPKDTLAIDKIYDILFDKIGYEVRYIKEIKDDDKEKIWSDNANSFNAILGYFINTDKPNIISATTGDVLNYSGEIYKDSKKADYTDISGLKAENEIKILTQMSIRYIENELKPNESLLQKDYFILLSQLNDKYYTREKLDDKAIDDMYDYLISEGIITKEEKAPMSTLTREEAAKYFVRFLHYKNVAEIKGIYKSSFKDTNKINPNLLGYVCIASGLKAMNGNKGYFYPKNKMTRLEGLLSVYSYLSNK